MLVLLANCVSYVVWCVHVLFLLSHMLFSLFSEGGSLLVSADTVPSYRFAAADTSSTLGKPPFPFKPVLVHVGDGVIVPPLIFKQAVHAALVGDPHSVDF